VVLSQLLAGKLSFPLPCLVADLLVKDGNTYSTFLAVSPLFRLPLDYLSFRKMIHHYAKSMKIGVLIGLGDLSLRLDYVSFASV
jgi:hypothetical protein